MNKPILCVDFDGVVHSYTSGWKGATIIPDPPVPGALKWLWKATEWFDVQIYSSRSKDPEARVAMWAWMVKHSADVFGPGHPMSNDDEEAAYPITFAYEKPAAFLTIDDRAYCFDGDWSELDPADLTQFKPWNKRPPVPKLGATGAFPDGKLGEHDEGALQFGVASSGDLVHVNFGKPVSWFALPKNDAKALAALLMKHATGGKQN